MATTATAATEAGVTAEAPPSDMSGTAGSESVGGTVTAEPPTDTNPADNSAPPAGNKPATQ
jgi:hypothetical protein